MAVAIVNANSGPLLRRALAALAAQTRPPDRTMVVDNASTDGSDRRARGAVLRRGGRSPERERRLRGSEQPRGPTRRPTVEWLALLNPDAFPEPRWLEELLEAAGAEARVLVLRQPDRDGGGSRTGWTPPATPSTSAASPGSAATESPRRSQPTRGEVFSASAAAALYRRDAFLEVGGFDERFFCYYEDTDLAFRLRLAGHRCWYVPTARRAPRRLGDGPAARATSCSTTRIATSSGPTRRTCPRRSSGSICPQHLLVNVLTVIAFARRRRFRRRPAGEASTRCAGCPPCFATVARFSAAASPRARELRAAMATGPGRPPGRSLDGRASCGAPR